MYSHTLEQECSPHSWPGLSSAQSLKSASTLSPALPGAVAVEVGGGQDGVGEESCERRKSKLYQGLALHPLHFSWMQLWRVTLLFPAPRGTRWGEELCPGAACVSSSPGTSSETLPLVLCAR